MLLFIDKYFYTIHRMGQPCSRHLLYIIFAATNVAATGCRHTHVKHHDTHTSGVRPSATTTEDKIGAQVLADMVADASSLTGSGGTHRLPGGGMAAAPEILAVSSSHGLSVATKVAVQHWQMLGERHV